MPAPAVITCPSCEKRFKGKPELGGKKIKCPHCTEPFVVPNEEAQAPTTTKPAPPAKIDIEPPKDDDAYGVGRIDLAPRCPHCAKEMVSADAVICIYCGYNTLTRVHGETKKLIAVSPREHLMYLLPSLSAAGAFVFCVILLIFYSTVLTKALEGTGWSWITHEMLRMWGTIVMLGLLWALGTFAFNTLALKPKPPDVEKE